MVTRRNDPVESSAEPSVEYAIQTVDIPLEQLRHYRGQARQSGPRPGIVAVPLPTATSSSSQNGVEFDFARVAPLTTVSRRIAGLCGLAVMFLVVASLSSQTVLGGDWSKSFGWPALPVLFVCLGYQMTTRALVVDRPGLPRPGLWTRQALALLGPIVLPTLVVTGVICVAGVAAFTMGPPETEAALAAFTLSSNLFAGGFGAGMDSALAPALDHLWVTALVAQFGLLLVFFASPVSRRGDRGHVAAVIAVTAAAVALARLAVLAAENLDAGAVVVHPLTGFDGLLAGAALALVPTALTDRLDRRAGWLAIAVLLGVFIWGSSTSDAPTLVWGVLTPLTALAAVGLAVSRIELVDRLLSSSVLRWLGQRAVGILIAHQLLGFASSLANPAPTTPTSVAIQLVFALAIGSVNHRYLQVPLMQATSGQRFGRNTRRAVAAPGDARLGSSAV